MNKQKSRAAGGSPPKPAPLSAAERARRYRAKKKAAGMLKRYVASADALAAEDLAYWVAKSHDVVEELRAASSKRDYFKREVERLHLENEQLWSRMREAEQINAVQLKELIVTRDKLTALQEDYARALAQRDGVPAQAAPPRTRPPRERK